MPVWNNADNHVLAQNTCWWNGIGRCYFRVSKLFWNWMNVSVKRIISGWLISKCLTDLGSPENVCGVVFGGELWEGRFGCHWKFSWWPNLNRLQSFENLHGKRNRRPPLDVPFSRKVTNRPISHLAMLSPTDPSQQFHSRNPLHINCWSQFTETELQAKSAPSKSNSMEKVNLVFY